MKHDVFAIGEALRRIWDKTERPLDELIQAPVSFQKLLDIAGNTSLDIAIRRNSCEQVRIVSESPYDFRTNGHSLGVHFSFEVGSVLGGRP